MKRFYFTSNGNIVCHARFSGAFRRSNGTLAPPKFELLGVECGDANGCFEFPGYWWNDAKACGGYFHLVREEDLFENDILYSDGSVLSKAQPHQQDETEDYFCEMELGKQHLPAFPIQLPAFGKSAKDRLWSKDSVARWEYKYGDRIVWIDGQPDVPAMNCPHCKNQNA